MKVGSFRQRMMYRLYLDNRTFNAFDCSWNLPVSILACDFLPGDLCVFPLRPPSWVKIGFAWPLLDYEAVPKIRQATLTSKGEREREREKQRRFHRASSKLTVADSVGPRRAGEPPSLSVILGGRKGGSERSIARPSPLCPNNVTNNLIRLSQTPLWGVVQRSSENAPSPLLLFSSPLIFLPLSFILPLPTFFSICFFLFFFLSFFFFFFLFFVCVSLHLTLVRETRRERSLNKRGKIYLVALHP